MCNWLLGSGFWFCWWTFIYWHVISDFTLNFNLPYKIKWICKFLEGNSEGSLMFSFVELEKIPIVVSFFVILTALPFWSYFASLLTLLSKAYYYLLRNEHVMNVFTFDIVHCSAYCGIRINQRALVFLFLLISELV